MSPQSAVVGPMERAVLFASIETLGMLGLGASAILAKNSRVRTYRKGEVIYRAGEVPDRLGVIAEGQVASNLIGNRETLVGPGGLLGSLKMLALEAYTIDVRSVTSSIVVELSSDAFSDIVEDHVSIAFDFIQRISAAIASRVAQRGEHPVLPIESDDATLPSDWLPEPSTLVQRLLWMANRPPFQNASLDSLAGLIEKLTEERFSAEQVIWSRGDPSQKTAFIIYGKVELRDEQGRVFPSGRGASLGAFEALAGVPRNFDLRALTPAVTLMIDREHLFEVMEDEPQLALNMLGGICQAFIRSLERDDPDPPSDP